MAWASRQLLNKAESGGFGLELYRSSTGARVLRFGVHVAGGYQYATHPLDGLNGSNGYLITGCYDGNGKVRLWVDNKESLSPVGPSPEGCRTRTFP